MVWPRSILSLGFCSGRLVVGGLVLHGGSRLELGDSRGLGGRALGCRSRYLGRGGGLRLLRLDTEGVADKVKAEGGEQRDSRG
jgi:hypothetical protein